MKIEEWRILKTRDKIYVIVPSTLLGLTLIVLILNNYIISYLPPSILSIYPLRPCWPSDGMFLGIDYINDLHFLNEKSSYHIGEPINPSLRYTTVHGIFTPNIYIKNSQNQTIWHYTSHSLKDGCGIALHYNIQDLTEAPRLNQTGQYEIFAGFLDKFTSFRFSVISWVGWNKNSIILF